MKGKKIVEKIEGNLWDMKSESRRKKNDGTKN